MVSIRSLTLRSPSHARGPRSLATRRSAAAGPVGSRARLDHGFFCDTAIVVGAARLPAGGQPGAAAALDEGEAVLPLFVLDPVLLRCAGTARRAWLLAALHALDADLRTRAVRG